MYGYLFPTFIDMCMYIYFLCLCACVFNMHTQVMQAAYMLLVLSTMSPSCKIISQRSLVLTVV